MLPSLQNNTTLFNVYGATEVSSWQTCYQITFEDLFSAKQCPDVPIGECLLGTIVDLRDCGGTAVDLSDNECTTVDQQGIGGSASSQGSGEIWIGKETQLIAKHTRRTMSFLTSHNEGELSSHAQ